MNVFQFPTKHQAPARPIPREEFERLAELALDVVDQIVALLEEEAATSAQEAQVVWLSPSTITARNAEH